VIAHAPLIARAIDISSRTRSGYYDCLYVALAEREGCPLITADQKSLNNLAPHFPFIIPLANLPWMRERIRRKQRVACPTQLARNNGAHHRGQPHFL
jgi:hypothetical protein